MTSTIDSVQHELFVDADLVSSQYVEADGYRTHYLEAGSRNDPPLFLVHGGGMELGMASDRWYPVVGPLAKKGFHVFAIDELGYGDTDAPRDLTKLCDPTQRAKHVIATLDALKLGKVHLLGQSEGGWIVTYIALTRPDLVEKLIVVDSGSTAGSGWSADGKSRHLPYFDNAFEKNSMVPTQNLSTIDGVREHARMFVQHKDIPEPYLRRMLTLSEKWNEIHYNYQRQFWADAATAWERKYAGYSIDGTYISELVHNLSMQTLVLWGRNSNKGIDKGIELFKKIPGSQLHVFDDANHFCWVDQPVAFNTLVTAFCEGEL
jgi:pimeloyl-ACP methyl ester carboxylesterase